MRVTKEEIKEYELWHWKAEGLLNALTPDNLTNVMLLASELRNSYRIGMMDGVKKYNNEPR
jgi:hypothetical protein